VPWATEDWNGLLSGDPAECEGGCDGALRSVLHRIPERERMSVALVGPADPVRIGYLESHYGSVSALPADLGGGLDRRFDLILATRPARSEGGLDELLERIHRRLVEGGILILTLPAASTMGGMIELRLDEGRPKCDRPIHEVELQYRLARAGYQGTRIRRIADEQAGSTILAMAARRASN